MSTAAFPATRLHLPRFGSFAGTWWRRWQAQPDPVPPHGDAGSAERPGTQARLAFWRDGA